MLLEYAENKMYNLLSDERMQIFRRLWAVISRQFCVKAHAFCFSFIFGFFFSSYFSSFFSVWAWLLACARIYTRNSSNKSLLSTSRWYFTRFVSALCEWHWFLSAISVFQMYNDLIFRTHLLCYWMLCYISNTSQKSNNKNERTNEMFIAGRSFNTMATN